MAITRGAAAAFPNTEMATSARLHRMGAPYTAPRACSAFISRVRAVWSVDRDVVLERPRAIAPYSGDAHAQARRIHRAPRQNDPIVARGRGLNIHGGGFAIGGGL